MLTRQAQNNTGENMLVRRKHESLQGKARWEENASYPMFHI